MTLSKSGRCIILAFPGRTNTGMCQVYRYDILLTAYFGAIFQGIRCVSCILLYSTASRLTILLSYRQQAISGLTQLPADVFEGSGGAFHTFGLSWFLSFLWPLLIGAMQASNTSQIPSHAQTGTSHGKWTTTRRSGWARVQSDLIKAQMVPVSISG